MHLSRRGRRLLDHTPFPEYLREHFVRSESGDEGYVGLCVAENVLLAPELASRLDRCAPTPTRALAYDAMVGSRDFREALASFLGRWVFGRPPDPEHLAVLAGAGSVLEILFWQLADRGEGVLLPTPSYPGFWMDLETRAELRIVEVPGRDADGFRIHTDDLDRAFEESPVPIRALIVTSPSNPLGTVLAREEIVSVADWAERREIHVVFDEVYALSVHPGQTFTSIGALRDRLGDRVHVVWAFSKDFGASGLRCGVLWSENEEILRAVDALAYWSAVSGHTQRLLGEVVSDRRWVDDFLDRSSRSLGRTRRIVEGRLAEAGIRTVPAGAAFFLFCDLRDRLDEATFEGERRLWKALIDGAGVNLTPGGACRGPTPGFFRLCYAGADEATVRDAVERMVDFLGAGRSSFR